MIENVNKSNTLAMNEIANSINGSLSDEAKGHLRAFAKFYLWASPLFELGHVIVKGNGISFSHLISKRLSIGMQNDIPSIGFQASELEWVRHIPWAWAGVNVTTGAIFLAAKPANPLNVIIFMIHVDMKHKIIEFKGQKKLNLIHIPGSVGVDPFKLQLDLRDVSDEQLSKAKLKVKPPKYEK